MNHIQIAQEILLNVDPDIAPDEDQGLLVQLAQAHALVAIAEALAQIAQSANADRVRQDMIALYSNN